MPGAARSALLRRRASPALARFRAGFSASSAAVAVLLAASFLAPGRSRPPRRRGRDRAAKAAAIARAFLLANGVDPGRYHEVAYPGTGFRRRRGHARRPSRRRTARFPAFSEGRRAIRLLAGGSRGLPQAGRRRLPLAFWVVRFFQPEKKEEWKVLVDARRARVVGIRQSEGRGGARGAAPVAGGGQAARPRGGGEARLSGGRLHGRGRRHAEPAQARGHDRRPRVEAPGRRRGAAAADGRLPRRAAGVAAAVGPCPGRLPARVSQEARRRLAARRREGRRDRRRRRRRVSFSSCGSCAAPSFAGRRLLVPAGGRGASGRGRRRATVSPPCFARYPTQMPLAAFEFAVA